MKSLLVPVEDTDRIDGALHLAAAFSAKFQSKIDAVALRLAHFQAVGAEPIVAVTLPPANESDYEIATRARNRFDTFVKGQPNASAFRWRGGDPIDDQSLGALARVYDLTVVGRPGSADAATRMTTFEAALFESGRPLLIAPPVMSGADVSAASFGTHAVISWNCSTEAAHTVAAALPVLLAADRVTILTVEGAIVPGPDAAALADYLAIHGITATQVAKPRSSMGPGKAILEATRELGGDLLIKSAYTQSRLRQMIFGGATAEVLAETTLPVFMAN